MLNTGLFNELGYLVALLIGDERNDGSGLAAARRAPRAV